MSKYDLVLHVDKIDGSINIAFSNAVNYAHALEGEQFKMVLLLNSKAVTHMVANSTDMNREKMDLAVQAGLVIKVCQNALNVNGLKAVDLCPGCQIVPAGLVELVDLQRAGYAYIKP